MKTNFKNGQKIYAVGLDMNCRKVVCVGKFIEYLEEPVPLITHDGSEMVLDCVVKVDGCSSTSESDTIYSTRAEAEFFKDADKYAAMGT